MNVASSFAAKTEEYFSQVPVPKIQEVADEVGVFYIYCLYLSVFPNIVDEKCDLNKVSHSLLLK